MTGSQVSNFKVGDRVYHPEFRKDGQYTGEGSVTEIGCAKGDEWYVVVLWDDGTEEGYDPQELEDA
jgi:hypothetical protein